MTLSCGGATSQTHRPAPTRCERSWEIHVAIGSQSLDIHVLALIFQNKREALSANHTVDGRRDCIGADSPTYLPWRDAIESVGIRDGHARMAELCVKHSAVSTNSTYSYEKSAIWKAWKEDGFY